MVWQVRWLFVSRSHAGWYPTSSEVVQPAACSIGIAELPKKPELVNTDPYGQGWMLVIKMSNAKDVDGLMSAADYEKLTAGGGH